MNNIHALKIRRAALEETLEKTTDFEKARSLTRRISMLEHKIDFYEGKKQQQKIRRAALEVECPHTDKAPSFRGW